MSGEVEFNNRKSYRDDGAVLVEFHEGRTGNPHPPDDSTLRWESRMLFVPSAAEGVTFPNGRHVIVTNVIHVLGGFRGQHYVVADVSGDPQ